MFSSSKQSSKQTSSSNKALGTIIGEGITIESGKIKGNGDVRIDGSFSGNIDLEGNLIIGTSGNVEADIHSQDALIAGTVKGNIVVSDTLHLTESAQLIGEVECNKMIMDEDATFNGHCIMKDANSKTSHSEVTLKSNFKDFDNDMDETEK